MAPKKNRKTAPTVNQPQATSTVSATPERMASTEPVTVPGYQWLALLAIVTGLFLWAYWPTLDLLVGQWIRVQDYSHGFLVAPIALYILWLTREGFVAGPRTIYLGGVLLLLAAMGLRLGSAYFYLEALHGWSIPLWATGVVWMFFGPAAFLWSLPALAFLVFMVPLPYSIEHMLSLPLQKISTQISLFMLQCCGLPALAEGTTISLGTQMLEVEKACSGLRIFFGITALAYAFSLLFKRPWWMKALLFAAVLPITLLANSLRITVTGLLYQLGMSETANHLFHDMAGWFMIPMAAGLFALTLAYLDRLFPLVSSIDARSMVQRQTQRQTARSS